MKYLLFAGYVLLLIFLTLFSYAYIDPNLFYLKRLYSGFAFEEREMVTAVFVIFIFVLFFFYFAFIWLFINKKLSVSSIKWLIGITTITLLFSYPTMLSYDIFNYILTAKALYFYKENPYLIMPIEFTNEPLLLFTHAANKIALYGPAWILLTGVPYVLGFGNFVTTLFAFKAVNVFFYLGISLLLWKLAKNLLPIILFSLNPLIVMETLVSSHNDIAMMFFALLSFLLLTRRKIGYAVLAFLVSVLIKYATVFLFPIFLYAAVRTYKNEAVDWQKIFAASSLSMFAIFLLSPLREEIYPWYGTWFLSFAALLPKRRVLLYTFLAFSFGLLLRYIPFMLSGTHSGYTPIVKTFLTFMPPLLTLPYFILSKKVWAK